MIPSQVSGASASIPVADLASDDVAVVEIAGSRIAVFHVDGEFFAIEDRCTHQDANLSDGFLEGCAVECPLHASLFDLRTGEPSGPPAVRPVRTHGTSVSDGLVHVWLHEPPDGPGRS